MIQTKKDLMEQIRVKKERTGMSYQSIAMRTEELGHAVTARTIQRVLAGENARTETLYAIAGALGIDTSDRDMLEQYALENHALTAKLEEAERHIQHKDDQIQSMRKVVQAHEDHISTQINLLAAKDRRIAALTIGCCTMLTAAALLLGFDILQPNTGYIRIRKKEKHE